MIWQRKVFHDRVLLIPLQDSCSVVSAQRCRAGHVLLVRRGSQQRAFSLGRHGESDDMFEGGGEDHVSSDTAVPSWESASQRPEEARAR